MKTAKREPWHYDATRGRPQWSKQAARLAVLRRQQANLEAGNRQGRPK